MPTFTILDYVRTESDEAAVRKLRLVQNGGNLDPNLLEDYTGRNGINIGAYHNKEMCVKYLASLGADVNNADVNHGTTGLMEAGRKGNNDMIKLLLSLGAKVDLKDKAGHTALWHCAAYSHHRIACQALLAAGAEVSPEVLEQARSGGWEQALLDWRDKKKPVFVDDSITIDGAFDPYAERRAEATTCCRIM